MEELVKLLLGKAPMSKKLMKRLGIIVKRIEFKKGQKILIPGQVCKTIFYVESGLIRIYHMLGNQEVTDWFIREGDICISVGSFFLQLPSTEYHVALEDCVVYGISFEELEETYAKFPKFNIHGRLICQQYYTELDNRTKFLKLQENKVKYAALMDANPSFMQRLATIHVASYLGVSRSTLQKIKRAYLNEASRNAARKNRLKHRQDKGSKGSV